MESIPLEMEDIYDDEAEEDFGGGLPDLPEEHQPEAEEAPETNNDENSAEVLARLKKLGGAGKRVVKHPQPKLDADRLSGERGIGILPGLFKGVKFKGKGYEAADLKQVMQKLEHWAHRLFPRMTFDEVLERVERLGSKKPVQTCVKRIRLDMPLPGQEVVDDEDAGDQQGQATQGEVGIEEDAFDAMLRQEREKDEVNAVSHVSPLSSPLPSTSKATPAVSTLTAEQQERIERNKRLAMERRAARARGQSQQPEGQPTEDGTSREPMVGASAESSARDGDSATAEASLPALQASPTPESAAAAQSLASAAKSPANSETAEQDVAPDNPGTTASARNDPHSSPTSSAAPVLQTSSDGSTADVLQTSRDDGTVPDSTHQDRLSAGVEQPGSQTSDSQSQQAQEQEVPKAETEADPQREGGSLVLMKAGEDGQEGGTDWRATELTEGSGGGVEELGESGKKAEQSAQTQNLQAGHGVEVTRENSFREEGTPEGKAEGKEEAMLIGEAEGKEKMLEGEAEGINGEKEMAAGDSSEMVEEAEDTREEEEMTVGAAEETVGEAEGMEEMPVEEVKGANMEKMTPESSTEMVGEVEGTSMLEEMIAEGSNEKIGEVESKEKMMVGEGESKEMLVGEAESKEKMMVGEVESKEKMMVGEVESKEMLVGEADSTRREEQMDAKDAVTMEDGAFSTELGESQ